MQRFLRQHKKTNAMSITPSSASSTSNFLIQGVTWIPVSRALSTTSDQASAGQASDVMQQETEATKLKSGITQQGSEWEIKGPTIGLALSLLGLIGAISLLSVALAKSEAGEDPNVFNRLTYLGYGLLFTSISSATVGTVTLNKALKAKELQLKNNMQIPA